jgi:hypothetical protein
MEASAQLVCACGWRSETVVQQADESRDAFGQRLEQRIEAHYAAAVEQGDHGGHDVRVVSPGDVR